MESCKAQKSGSDSVDPRPADANKCSNQFGRCKCKIHRLWARGYENWQGYSKVSLYPVTMILIFFFFLLAITTFSHRLLVFTFSLWYRSPVTPHLNSIKVAPAVAVRPEHIGLFHPSIHARNRRTEQEQRRLPLLFCSKEYRHPDSKRCLKTRQPAWRSVFLVWREPWLTSYQRNGTIYFRWRKHGQKIRSENLWLPRPGGPPLFDDSDRSLSRFIYFMLDSIRTFKRYARYMAPSLKRRSRDQCLFFSIGLYFNSTWSSFSSLSSWKTATS